MEKPVQSSFLPARWRFDRLFFFSLGRLVPRGHSERIIASAEPLLSGVQFHSPSSPPPPLLLGPESCPKVNLALQDSTQGAHWLARGSRDGVRNNS